MRYLYCFALLHFVCSCSSNIENKGVKSDYKELNDNITLNSIQDINLETEKVFSFIKKTKLVNDKTTFLVDYKITPLSSLFIAKLKEKININGFGSNNIKFNVVNESTYAVKVTSKYSKIVNSDCHYLTFNKRDDYKFGCIIQYNRKNSFIFKS